MSGENFDDKDLSGSSLEGRDLTNASFQRANLSGVSFKGCTMRNADLRGADCSHANFTGADLTGATLFDAKLYGAVFHMASLTNADLRKTRTREGTFQGVFSMKGARLPRVTRDRRVLSVHLGEAAKPLIIDLWRMTDGTYTVLLDRTTTLSLDQLSDIVEVMPDPGGRAAVADVAAFMKLRADSDGRMP